MHPVLFQIGSFKLHSFGAAMVLAFLAGIYLAQRRAERYGLNKNQVGDMAFWVLIAGIIGARVVYIYQDRDYYLKHPSDLLTLQFQGLTSFGGLIFGAIAALAWAKKSKNSAVGLIDLLTPAFLAGHIIGRIGCLLNGCCFGGKCPSDLAWGISIKGSSFLHHPAQAYDSLMNIAALGVVLWAERRGLRPGQLFGLGIGLHGVTRFVYEFWRAGTVAQVSAGEASSTYMRSLPITEAQLMAAILVVAGLVAFFWPKRQPVLSPSA